VLFAGVLRADERREFNLGTGLTLKVGDAGAFAFAMGGVPGRSLGNSGQVVTLSITPENFRDFLSQ
jgi:hypothetical protein